MKYNWGKKRARNQCFIAFIMFILHPNEIKYLLKQQKLLLLILYKSNLYVKMGCKKVTHIRYRSVKCFMVVYFLLF